MGEAFELAVVDEAVVDEAVVDESLTYSEPNGLVASPTTLHLRCINRSNNTYPTVSP